MIVSISTLGWIATIFSGFGTMSPIPLAYRVRVRGFLDGENVDPWIMMIVYDSSVCIYAFNSKTETGWPLKIFCLSDIIVSSFLALTALKLTKDPVIFDHYVKILWFFGVTIPIILLFINHTFLLGLWMTLVCFSNASSVFSSLGRIFKNGLDEHAERAFDPLMLSCRLCAGIAWSLYSYLDFDIYVFICALWSTFCPLASLCVFFMVHAQAKAMKLKQALIVKYNQRKSFKQIVSKKVIPELKVIHILSKSEDRELAVHRDVHVTTDSNTYPSSSGNTMECSICISSIAFSDIAPFIPPVLPPAAALDDDDDDDDASEEGGVDVDVENQDEKEEQGERQVQQAITLHCGHSFCCKCLKRCSEFDMKTCPICRKEHELSPQVLRSRLINYRSKYQDWRKGQAHGAKGEVDDISGVPL